MPTHKLHAHRTQNTFAANLAMEAYVYETRRRSFTNRPTKPEPRTDGRLSRVKIEDSAGDDPQFDYERGTIKREGGLELAESKALIHSWDVTNG